MWNSASYLLLILTLTSEINFTEGFKWVTKSSQIDKCIGQTANLTWEYVKEANEEIRQLQWRFNSTKVIAYSSKKNGFYVDPQYHGRVEQSGDNGILLTNISAKDIGNYTLYPVIAWEESSNIPSVWLNVIEPTMQQWCTCERLPLSPEWGDGRMFSIQIVADGCNLEINSSFCCPVGPAIKCSENDSQKLCIPIRNPFNVNNSSTQYINPNNLFESTIQRKGFVTIAPVVVQKGNTESDHVNLALSGTNTITSLVSMLILCYFLYVFWKIPAKLGRDKYGQKLNRSMHCLEAVTSKLNESFTAANEDGDEFVDCSNCIESSSLK